jgi:hypothetical protein
MRTYVFNLEGEGELLPAVEWVTVRDDARAVELAAKRLRDWPAVTAIEIHFGASVVSRLERDAPGERGGRRGSA